jgi:hypothetical protein
MVLDQLGFWKNRILLQTIQFTNTFVHLLSFRVLEDYRNIYYDPLIKHELLKYLFLNSKQASNLFKKNDFVSSNKYENIFLYKQKKRKFDEFQSLIEPNFLRIINGRKNIQIQFQETKDDQNDTNSSFFHKLLHKQHNKKHELTLWQFNDECDSLYNIQTSNNTCVYCLKKSASIIWKPYWKKCEGLQDIKHYYPCSSNYEYEPKSQGIRLRLHRVACHNFRKFSSNSRVSNIQTNSKGDDDENARKLAKDAEDKAKRLKEINDDNIQTTLQLELLKAQVKKVHDEMQARKYESWTVKIGKLVSNIGNIIIKIGPTIGSILSMSR